MHQPIIPLDSELIYDDAVKQLTCQDKIISSQWDG